MNTCLKTQKSSHALTLYRISWIVESPNGTLVAFSLLIYRRGNCGCVEFLYEWVKDWEKVVEGVYCQELSIKSFLSSWGYCDQGQSIEWKRVSASVFSCILLLNRWATIGSCAVALFFWPKIDRKRFSELFSLSQASLFLVVGVFAGHCPNASMLQCRVHRTELVGISLFL